MKDLSIVLSKASSFEEFYKIIQHAEADISFWGNRYLQVKGCSGTVNLDSLPLHVIQILKRHLHFDETERSFGKKIVEKVDRLYSQSDQRLLKRNWVTRLFFVIIEGWIKCFQGWGYGARFQWRINKEVFNYYTATQYQRAFEWVPKHEPDLHRQGEPKRWLREIGYVRV